MDNKGKEFAEAMQTKLRLNREKRNSQDSEVSAAANEQSVQTDANSLRASIIEETRKRHPDLTDETANKMMDEFGA